MRNAHHGLSYRSINIEAEYEANTVTITAEIESKSQINPRRQRVMYPSFSPDHAVHPQAERVVNIQLGLKLQKTALSVAPTTSAVKMLYPEFERRRSSVVRLHGLTWQRWTD